MSKCRSGDIAIVELETALPESADYYDMACLPTRRVKLTGRNLISAGYGYDPDNVAATEKHMEKVIYSKEPFCDPSIKVGKDAFCVVEKGQFACKGDSGSGVMQPASKLRDYVMGVLAIGLNCNDVQVEYCIVPFQQKRDSETHRPVLSFQHLVGFSSDVASTGFPLIRSELESSERPIL
uniref:Peptidase S1 domain-containing protein n=1 Tax=Angiostrongylus cantonensis TaxID=6313 RepID=A0A0K0DAT6_ANGCA